MGTRVVKQPEFTPDEQVLADINRKYVYVLAQKNDQRGRVFDIDGNPLKSPEYKSRQNLLLQSSIVWDGSEDPWSGKARKPGKYLIRFYDGCTTLFVDDQPKELDTIAKFMKSTRELFFILGYLDVYGYDTMLKAYMDMCSWNGESKYRIKTAAALFILLDSEKILLEEGDALDQMEEALEKAKNAKVAKMRMHCKFLNVADTDLKTMNPLSDTALRSAYRQEAKRDPVNFLKTFKDEDMQVRFWIDRALDNGEISTTIIPNQAVWSKKGVPICEISGLTTREGFLNKLIEFSKMPIGAEFLDQLKTSYA